MGDHSMVGPYGRALDVPGSVEDLQRPAVDPSAPERLPGLGGLDDARRVSHDDPSGPKHTLGVRDDAPRLGKVQDDAVERAAVDPLVAVSELDVVAVERLGTCLL